MDVPVENMVTRRVWVESVFDVPAVSLIRRDATGPLVYSPANGWQSLPSTGRPTLDQVFRCNRYASGSCFGRLWYADIPASAIWPDVTAISLHWLSGNSVNDSLGSRPIDPGVGELRVGYLR